MDIVMSMTISIVNRPSQQKSNKWTKPYFELKQVGIVLTKCEGISGGYDHLTNVESLEDYKDEVFGSFKNGYSAEFSLPK